jgi:hypothetical protein
MMRVKLGSSTIFDSDGSTSATDNKPAGADIYLYMDDGAIDSDPAPNVTWQTSTTGATVTFWVGVQADTAANLKTAADDVEAAIHGVGDCTIERAADTTLTEFKTSTGDYLRASGQVEHYWSDLGCNLRCTLTFDSTPEAASSGGAGEAVDGLATPLETQVQRGSWGGLQCQIRANFLGDESTSARAKAITFANQVRNRDDTAVAGLEWLPAENVLRIASEDFTPIVPETDTEASQGGLTITLVQMSTELAGLIEKIRLADWNCDITGMSMPQDSGAVGQFMVDCSVAMSVKIDGDNTFDAADTPNARLTTAERNAALALIWTKVKASLPQFATFKILDAHISPEGTEGRYECNIKAIANGGSNPMLSFSSSVKILDTRNSTLMMDTLGASREYSNRNPSRRTVQHRYAAQQVGVAPTYFKPAGIGNGWIKTASDLEKDTAQTVTYPTIGGIADGGNVTQYSRQWNVVYQEARASDVGASIAGTIFEDAEQTGIVEGG